MFLILNRTCANCHIRQQIGQVTMVTRIEHLLSTSEAGLLNNTRMQMTNGNQTI